MEPERHIEKVLRAYAKKRREKSPDPELELHPVTRRLLHAEIARRAPRRGENSFFLTLFAAFRRRLVLASCLAAVAAIGALLLLPESTRPTEEVTLDFNPSFEPQAESAPVPVTAPALEPARSLRDEEKSKRDDSIAGGREINRLEDRKLEVANADQNQPREPAATKDLGTKSGTVSGEVQPSSTLTLDGAVAFKGMSEVDRLRLQKGTPEKAAGQAGNESLAFASTQRYAQTDGASNAQYRDKNIASPVLASFQVQQQSDRQIRVVDQDGSVYSGYWQPGDATVQGHLAVAQKVPMESAATPKQFQAKDAREYKDGAQAAQNYYFRVAGMNQSLKQNVVFTGNLTAITNGVPLIQTNNLGIGGGAAGGFQSTLSNQSLQLLLSNSRISGTAVIDSNKEIEVNAAPAGN